MPTSVSLQSLSTTSLESGAVSNALVLTWQGLWQQLTLSNLWKSLLVLHIAANFKLFPFVYHLRILNTVRFVLRSQRPKDDVKPEHLFQPIITSSKAPLMEIDVFGHKSNSTYFADVDVARVHLVTTLFGNGICKFRGNTTMNGLNGKTSKFTLALGAVSCTFRRELLPYEPYDMWTRILTWDEKWVYMVTHFVKKGAKIDPHEVTLYPNQNKDASRKLSIASEASSPETSTTNNGSPVAASAVSKVVFKDGRKTITPPLMLELSGLLPPRREEKLTEAISSTGQVNTSLQDWRRNSLRNWTWEAMEAERCRGLKLVQHLADQTAFEHEFTPEVALGRHYDGYGIEGVVSTLAQLAGLSSYQFL